MTNLITFTRASTNLILATILVCASHVASPQTPNQAAELIQSADLKAHLYFLASDDLAGRNITSTEDHIATDYIAAEFMRLGLKPVGDNGTYFQNMDIVSGDLDHQHTTLTAKIDGVDHTYALDQDFRWARRACARQTAVAPIVFAGYGINAPEFSYNDLAGIDLKGKVALVFTREPQADDPNSKFMGTLDTYHAFNWQKVEELRKHGVAGMLVVQGESPARSSQSPLAPRAPPAAHPIALAGQMWDVPVFTIQREVADQLLAPSGKTVDTLQSEIDRTMQPNSFEVPTARSA